MMYTYPHTISNGGGEELTFVARKRDERGEYLEVRNRVAPGSGPPMHVHFLQEEGLTVEEGTIGYQVEGEEKTFVGKGERVVFAPGISHKFWNAGESDMLCVGYIRPPDNIEYFLTEIYASTKENGGERPNGFDAAWLAHRYRNEFAITEIPRFVQKTIFPIQRLIGKLMGRYKKYANAPEPIQPRT